MDITINTICPECKNKIRISSRAISEHGFDSDLFEFQRSSKAMEHIPSLIDIVKFFSESKKASQYIEDHFRDLSLKIKGMDIKELEKLKKNISKTKVKVSKDVLDEFKKNKKRLLKEIEMKLYGKDNASRGS